MVTHINQTNNVTNWSSKFQEDFRPFYKNLGIWTIFPKQIKKNQKITTRNRLDLETLGSRPIYAPEISPDTGKGKGNGGLAFALPLSVHGGKWGVIFATCSREPRWCGSNLRHPHATCPPSEVKRAEPHSIASLNIPKYTDSGKCQCWAGI